MSDTAEAPRVIRSAAGTMPAMDRLPDGWGWEDPCRAFEATDEVCHNVALFRVSWQFPCEHTDPFLPMCLTHKDLLLRYVAENPGSKGGCSRHPVKHTLGDIVRVDPIRKM